MAGLCSHQKLYRTHSLPLPGSGSYCHSLACGCITSVSALVATLPSPLLCVCHISLCLPLMRIYVITFREHPDNLVKSSHLKLINLITHAKTFLPMDDNIHRFQGLGRGYFLGSHYQTCCTNSPLPVSAFSPRVPYSSTINSSSNTPFSLSLQLLCIFLPSVFSVLPHRSFFF